MAWQLSPAVLVELAASATLLVLAIYFPLKDINRQARFAGASLILTCSLWMLSHAVEITVPVAAYKELMLGFQLILAIAAVTFWLFYIVNYLGSRKFLKRRVYLLSGIMPLIATVALLTNGTYGLAWTAIGLDSRNPYLPIQPTYGAVYWACMVYAAVLTLAGSYLILWNVLRRGKSYGGQAIYLVVAALLPLLTAFIEVTGLPSPLLVPVGVTPLAACAGAIILISNLPQFHLDRVIPVARDISFERIEDCILIIDVQDRILDLNPAAERLIGIKISDALGLPVDEVWPFDSPFTKTVKEGQEVELEKDGRRQIYAVHTSSVTDSGGRTTSKAVFLSDITGRKKAEADLRNSEESYRSLIESALEAVIVIQSGLVKYANPRAFDIMGRPRERLDPQPFMDYIHPDDRAMVVDRHLRRLNGEEFEPAYPIRLVDKLGNNRWVQISTTVIQWQGQPATLTFLADISENKRVERMLEIQRDLGLKLSIAEDLSQALLPCLDAAIEISAMDSGGIYLVDPSTGDLRLACSSGLSQGFIDGASHFPNSSDNAALVLAGKPIYAQYADTAFKMDDVRRSEGLKAVALVPVSSGKRVIACLNIASHSVADIPSASRSALETIASQVGEAIARLQARDSLKESEGRYRLLAEHMTDTVWIMDMQFRTTYQSPSSERLRGFTPQEISEIPPEKNMTPDSFKLGSALFLEEMAKVEADPNYNFSRTVDLEFYRKDGSTFWSTNTFSLIRDALGRPSYILGEGRDITERKRVEEELRESEEKYRSVVENAQEAIFISVDGIIKFANSRASQLSGYTNEELCCRHFIDFVHPDDHQMMADRYRQWKANIEVPKTINLRVVFKQGDTRWAELSVVEINWEGSPAILSFLTDITGRKQLEEERQHLEEERQRVEKLESVGLLAGGIAHDFNNILASIMGNISLARTEAAPGSDLQNSLEQAEKASQRAKRLTQQLLTFSKGGAPVMKLAPLTELIQDTASFALHGSNVKCLFSIPPDLWHAEIDSGQVSQVIHNLVINAQQAMHSGGTIEISAENISISELHGPGRGLPLEPGDYIRIAVTDHGSGIPRENLEKIFDPFFTTKQKGSGLGLATSFSIARRHGGHLSVDSEPGSGSTFYLYLPASMKTAGVEQAGKAAALPSGKGRILVMDDEKGVREIAGRMLSHLGYKDVQFAEDGAEAVTLYEGAMKAGRPFDAVILDLTIAGGMGGEEAVRELLKIDKDVKAIVSSGYADDSAMAEYSEFGFSGMVAKPYTLEELGRALHEVIR